MHADEVLIKVTNWMVNTPAIYGAMKLLARQVGAGRWALGAGGGAPWAPAEGSA